MSVALKNEAAASQGGTAVDLFRKIIPELSDERGWFHTRAVRDYIESQGFMRGSAVSAIFYWSDPTGSTGFRRYRREAARKNKFTPNEPDFKNDRARTKKVTEMTDNNVTKLPTSAADTRRTTEENDALVIRTVARALNADLTFRYQGYMTAAQEMGRNTDSEGTRFFERQPRLYKRVDRGLYKLTDEGLQLLWRHDLETYTRLIGAPVVEPETGVNTEAQNDRPERRSLAALVRGLRIERDRLAAENASLVGELTAVREALGVIEA